jgi:hypothetical protein
MKERLIKREDSTDLLIGGVEVSLMMVMFTHKNYKRGVFPNRPAKKA